MTTIETEMAAARELTGNPKLRWIYLPEMAVCIGFTTNPDEPGVTVTPLTDGTVTTVKTMPDDTLQNVHWVYISQTAGVALYKWIEPHTGLWYMFVGRTGELMNPAVLDGLKKTAKWLQRRQQQITELLNTGLPLPLLKRVLGAAGLLLATQAITVGAALLAAHNHDIASLQQKMNSLRVGKGSDLSEVRALLSGYIVLDDTRLWHFFRAVRAVVLAVE